MPTRFLSSSQAAQLLNVARRYRNHVQLGQSWKKRTEDELWRKVLSQVVVVGRAEPGYRLEHNRKVGSKVSIKRLKKFRSNVELQKYLHAFLVGIGARFVSKKQGWRKDRKAAAGVYDFRHVMKAGGPREFFKQIAEQGSEAERMQSLQALKGYGDKGARDTLIDLGLAENCMALDARIYGLLEKVGVKVAPDDIYKLIERELIEKVAKPLRISGGRLDRILFQNYDRIRAEL